MPRLHAQLLMGNVIDDWCRLELFCPLGLLAGLFVELETMTLAENKLGLPQIVACMIAFTLFAPVWHRAGRICRVSGPRRLLGKQRTGHVLQFATRPVFELIGRR